MTLRGKIKNGGVVLDQPVSLPEGTVAIVQTMEDAATTASPPAGATIWQKLLELEGAAQGLPADLPERHDEYRRRRLMP